MPIRLLPSLLFIAIIIATTGSLQAAGTPPSTPANFKSIVALTTQIFLTWDASTDDKDSISYIISKGTTEIGRTRSTSFTATRLLPASAYSFSVKAMDKDSNLSAPATLTNVSTTAGTDGYVQLEYWSGFTGTTVESIPSRAPDGRDTIFALEVNKKYATTATLIRIRGIYKGGAHGEYVLSICAGAAAALWMSGNSNPQGLVKTASTPSATSVDQWDLFPEQTSTPRVITTGSNKYFEVRAILQPTGGFVKVGISTSGSVNPPVVIADAQLGAWFEPSGVARNPHSASASTRSIAARHSHGSSTISGRYITQSGAASMRIGNDARLENSLRMSSKPR